MKKIALIALLCTCATPAFATSAPQRWKPAANSTVSINSGGSATTTTTTNTMTPATTTENTSSSSGQPPGGPGGPNPQEFQQRKAEILQHMQQHLTEVQQRIQCVQSANDPQAVRACLPPRPRGGGQGGFGGGGQGGGFGGGRPGGGGNSGGGAPANSGDNGGSDDGLPQ